MTAPLLYPLAAAVVQQLSARHQRLALAESCTGGWAAKVITDVPGSSAVFERGFVTYSNIAKQQLLGVDPALLERHGAVSEAVVCAMAAGALRHSPVQRVAAVSGIAGPDGGTPEKPVGTVWLAWGDGDTFTSRCLHLKGDREAIRRQAVAALLRGLLGEG